MLHMRSIWDPPRFTTQHIFDKRGKWDPTQDLTVPFQHYSFSAFAFAIDPATNNSVHIVTLGIFDTPGDFIIRSHDAGDVIEFTYDSGNGMMTTEIESRLLRAEITRSAVAKALAICMFIANWALTIGSVYTTALVAFRRLEANSVVAALPFSALLTIPTIRPPHPDSPPLTISIGELCMPQFLLFHGLTDRARRGSVFCADCDRNAVFPGPVESPHKSSTPVTRPDGVLRLDFRRFYAGRQFPFLVEILTTYRASIVHISIHNSRECRVSSFQRGAAGVAATGRECVKLRNGWKFLGRVKGDDKRLDSEFSRYR